MGRVVVGYACLEIGEGDGDGDSIRVVLLFFEYLYRFVDCGARDRVLSM